MIRDTLRLERHPELPDGAGPIDDLAVLYMLGPQSPQGWLGRAISEETDRITVRECPSLTVAWELLRTEAYDVVVIDRDISGRPPAELLVGVQSSTHAFQPVVVLSDLDTRHDALDYLAAGAACYLPLHTTTPAELVWQLCAAARRARMLQDYTQLQAWYRRQNEQEQHEILSLLEEQSHVFGLAARLRLGPSAVAAAASADQTLVHGCRELLQSYMVQGRSQLAAEIVQFTRRLHEQQVHLAQLLQAFSLAVHELIRDRGARSSRHIYHRGHLLILDLLLHWTDQQPTRDSHVPFHRHPHLQRAG